ncbi:MAG TPA: hypothetical protein PLF81_24715 [Candidatus Anammoximicrobium sp.]|nr:hypothetical protein [Candidatus Anammoximicrobium sp.]
MPQTPDEVLAAELKKLAVRTTKKEAGAGVVSWVAKKLPTDAFKLELQIEADAETALRTAFEVLQEEGTLRDDIACESSNPTVSAVIGSGFLRLNPAVVTVEVVPSGAGNSIVTIVGAAKEGLIKQHGGQKAAERIAHLLRSKCLFRSPKRGEVS